jgi:hypothetical protein
VHTRCVAHSLHNGVKEDAFASADADAVLSAPVKLASFFSSISTTRNSAASKMAEQMGVALLKPVMPVATRWNSFHAAYERHLERWPVISRLNIWLLKLTRDKEAEYRGYYNLCNDNRGYYEGIVELLETTKEWTARLQASDSATASLLFIARSEILASLQPRDTDSPKVEQLRAKLLGNMMARLNDDFVPIRYPVMALSQSRDAKLQLRWKQVNTAALLDIRTAADHLVVLAAHYDDFTDYIAKSHVIWQHMVAHGPPAPAVGAGVATDHSAVLVKLQQLSQAATAVSPLAVTLAKVTEELLAYSSTVVATVAGKDAKGKLALDPLAWWRENKARFPCLAHVARTLLAAQATSAASERVFSAAGNIASKLRNTLTPDSLELCVLVRSAIKNGINLRSEFKR